MNKNSSGKGFSIISYLFSALIGFLLIVGALGYAASQGIEFGGIINTITTIFSGDKEEIEKSANDIQNSITGTDATTTSENTESSQVEDTVGTTTKYYEALVYTGEKQMVNGDYDVYGRASFGHIQLKYQDKPSDEREDKITFDPVGWHNYRFKYETDEGETSKAWLMNRGHLIGYLFSGLNSEGKNLVPMTRYLNAGTISDSKMDANNPYSMLFYELALNEWLKEHPTFTLDYYVVPNYTDEELIPRSISLFWTGFDDEGNHIKVELKDSGKAQYDGITGSVTLNNVSRNAVINYETGEATSIYE